MPLDGKISDPAIARSVLAIALRGQMPEDFNWNYCGTLTCAMGLAQAIGLIEDAFDDKEIERVFGMTEDQVDAIFYGGEGITGVWRGIVCPTYGCVSECVTAEMVAAALEAI